MGWGETQAKGASAIFHALDSRGFDWMVLRNHQGLPEKNRSKDIDLGLRKSDFDRAEHVISQAALGAGFERVLVESFQYVRCLTFFGVFADVAQSLKVDLLDGFTFRGAQIFEFETLWSRSRTENGVRIPHPTDDAVMLWMKPLLTGGIVKPGYLPDIEAAAVSDPQGFQNILRRAFGPKLSGMVWQLIEGGQSSDTVALQRTLRNAAWWSAARREPLQTLAQTGRHFAGEIIRRRKRNPASFMSVAGPDGVGKTTFIQAFSAVITDAQVKGRDSGVLGHFRPRILPNIRTLLTGRQEQLDDTHDPHSAKPANTASSVLRLTYYWFDYVVGYWLHLRRRAIRGGVVIFDRYFFDIIVDPRRSRLSLPKWVTRLYLAATPKPDFVLVLQADPALIHARKPELPENEIARQIKAYQNLAARDPDRFLLVDATEPPSLLAQRAVNEILTRAYQKLTKA